MFMLPFLNHVIAGTTDAKCGVSRQPVASQEEVEFILATLQDYLGIQVRRRVCACACACACMCMWGEWRRGFVGLGVRAVFLGLPIVDKEGPPPRG